MIDSNLRVIVRGNHNGNNLKVHKKGRYDRLHV